MNTRLHTFGVCVGLALTLLSGPSWAEPSISQFTSNNIKTMSLTSEITQDNQGELKKIKGDIALAYRLHKGAMQYMQPGKLRIEATIPHIATGYYIINGNRKCTVGPLYHRVQDVTGAPGKKQTLLDFGFVPPELFDDYKATFLRKDGADYVFQISPKNGDTTKDIVWIDPQTHITVKRENYDRQGKVVKWFLYKNPVRLSVGVFVPTTVELYNPQNKLAGVTVYQSVHVNGQINPSVFNF